MFVDIPKCFFALTNIFQYFLLYVRQNFSIQVETNVYTIWNENMTTSSPGVCDKIKLEEKYDYPVNFFNEKMNLLKR